MCQSRESRVDRRPVCGSLPASIRLEDGLPCCPIRQPYWPSQRLRIGTAAGWKVSGCPERWTWTAVLVETKG